MPRRLLMSVAPPPSACSLLISDPLFRAVGKRRLYLSSALGFGDAHQHPLAGEFTLELGNGPEHVEHQPASCVVMSIAWWRTLRPAFLVSRGLPSRKAAEHAERS